MFSWLMKCFAMTPSFSANDDLWVYSIFFELSLKLDEDVFKSQLKNTGSPSLETDMDWFKSLQYLACYLLYNIVDFLEVYRTYRPAYGIISTSISS